MTAIAKPQITTDLLVDAAIDLIAVDGLEALSMRRLADRFDIQAASIYWYVDSKDQLLNYVAERLLERAVQHLGEQRTAEVAPPRIDLMAQAIAYRSFLCLHPGSEQVLATRLPACYSLVALLASLGRSLTTSTTMDGARTLLTYIHAHVLAEKAILSVDGAHVSRESWSQHLATVSDDPWVSQYARASVRWSTDSFRLGVDTITTGLCAPE